MIVGDASAIVAALSDTGAGGEWAAGTLRGVLVVAPALMPAEVANVMRRAVIGGRVSDQEAQSTLQTLLELPLSLKPFEPYTERIWELKDNLTAYDAWYVAVAEAYHCPLATLDVRLARAAGPRCEFLVPD